MRRALLLFAIVLGMAALVASFSRPPVQRTETRQRAPVEPPTAAPAPSPGVTEALEFDAGEDESERLRAGRPATLEVSVDEAGSVEIPGLGLSASADTLTPARFDVLPAREGEYEILFTPADGDVAARAGTLVVRSAG